MPRTLFVSDLHLAAERPAAVAAFFGFLAREASQSQAIYILGDLFEYWIGDDDLGDPFNASIAQALARTAARGVNLHFMHGNRDFLIGREFCRMAGLTLLADPHRIGLNGRDAILMHGDTLCTDDHDYQSWRRIARSAEWQREILAESIVERRERVLELREKSRQAIRVKPAEIMDANDGAVRDALREHKVDLLIHGHTHRPAHHSLDVVGKACDRWVLPEWYGRGGYLVSDSSGLRLESL
jgi:UDP-2,3-diacylglucosamine hydrolase